MVPPSSDRISRVPPYLSCAQYHRQVFVYGAVTRYGRPFQTIPLTHATIVRKADPISLATTFGISVDFFSCSYLDVSVRCVRLASLCIQLTIPPQRRGGFPHSDICGSTLACQLPAAFRRLPRPSSPVIAKASTTCTYSLDPITLHASILARTKANQSRNNQNVCYRLSLADQALVVALTLRLPFSPYCLCLRTCMRLCMQSLPCVHPAFSHQKDRMLLLLLPNC